MTTPFETKIRNFMQEIDDELKEVETGLDLLPAHHEPYDKTIAWRNWLMRLSEMCLLTIDKNIDYRKTN